VFFVNDESQDFLVLATGLLTLEPGNASSARRSADRGESTRKRCATNHHQQVSSGYPAHALAVGRLIPPRNKVLHHKG